jgi:hypothetical protein
MKNNYMIPALLLIGTICFVSAFILYKNKNNPNKEVTNENTTSDENTQKGKAFEEYVIDLFLKEHQVQLVSRVSDYFKNGKYAQDNKTPDLKFIYKNKPFAIECKYRSSFAANNSITWATEYQINNYKKFETENNIKVFVAIGIGGTPIEPLELYLVPLYRLTKPFAQKDYIKEFRVTNIQDFLGIYIRPIK